MSKHKGRNKQIVRTSEKRIKSLKSQGALRPSTTLRMNGAQRSFEDDNAEFGPGRPAEAATIGSGAPRRWQYPMGWNASLNMRSQPGRSIDFNALRTLAEIYDVLRMCIEVRKAEVRSMEWRISPHPNLPHQVGKGSEMNHLSVDSSHTRLAALVRNETQSNVRNGITKLTAFFESPDGEHTFGQWVAMAIEEVLVVDSLAIYKRQNMAGGLHSLEIIDGTTIKPLLAADGRSPEPPMPAYQQYLYGAPRSEFTRDEMIYRPRNVRTWTPYGFSNVEQVIATVNLALRRQQWHLNYFTDGNIPEGLISAPESWSAQQVGDYEDAWNTLLAGDGLKSRRLKFVPSGSAYTPIRPPVHNLDFDRWLLWLTCAGMDVQPMELGFEPAQGLGGAGFAKMQENTTYRKSLRPLLRWLEEMLDEVIAKDFGMPELCFRFVGGETEDQKADAEVERLWLTTGVKTINEIRARHGDAPCEGGDTPYVMAGGNVVAVRDLRKTSGV